MCFILRLSPKTKSYLFKPLQWFLLPTNGAQICSPLQFIVPSNNSFLYRIDARKVNYSWPSISVGSTSTDSTIYEQKILTTKNYVVADMHYVVKLTMVLPVLNIFRLFFLSLFPKQYDIGITSNLKMISSIQEDTHRLHANTLSFYMRDLSIFRFCYPQGVLKLTPRRYLGMTVQ